MSAPARIFCIGRNYAAHIEELGHVDDGECLVFMKPATCITPVGRPIVLPRQRGEVHFEAEMTVRLGRDVEGGLEPAEALDHVDAIGLGLDLTLRDLQNTLRKRGAPWELCKAFDGAAPLGPWQPFSGQDLQALQFTCTVNGEPRQHADTAQMLFPVARLLHILAQTWTLRAGDIVYTGTPAGVGALQPGDTITVSGASLGEASWTCR
ncbi:MAG: fumarylacetoacetate hydrolase family protein [Algiphilus sp.]